MEGLPHVAEAMNCSSKNVPKTPTKTGTPSKVSGCWTAASVLVAQGCAGQVGPWLYPSDKFNRECPPNVPHPEGEVPSLREPSGGGLQELSLVCKGMGVEDGAGMCRQSWLKDQQMQRPGGQHPCDKWVKTLARQRLWPGSAVQ